MQRSAQLLFHGGRIVTLDPANPLVEAIAVADGRIIAVGTTAELSALASPSTKRVNLADKVLLPSLKDHHLHLVAIGFALLNQAAGGKYFADLSAVASADEMIATVARRAAAAPRGSWIVGAGWNEVHWSGMAVPTHHALSAALPDHPAFLVRIDSHSALVNSAAMRQAGITRDSPDPYGGAILRDASGLPTGILLERAVEAVLDNMPVPDDEVVRDAFRLGAQSLARRGYTSVYDAGIMHFPGLVAMNAPMEKWIGILSALDATEPLPVEVNLMLPAPSAMAERVLSGAESRQQSPGVRFTHLKLYADGAFGSRGALMREPYTDNPSLLGVSRMTEEEMLGYCRRALAVDLDVAIHAIGDVAVERVLNVFEMLLSEDRTLAPRRLRLEHFSVATAPDIDRAARLGILLVAQPGFVWPGANGKCMEDYRLGPERVRRAYAWRSLLDRGAQIAGSSDDYSLPPHPLWNFYAALTRMNPEGIPAAGWQPQEKLTREESIQLFTRFAEPGGSYRRGVLAPGEHADLIVLSGDPLVIDESEVLRIAVESTWRAGKQVRAEG